MDKTETLTSRKGCTAPEGTATSEHLRSAARLVEDSAFALATAHPTEVIAQLIIIAADLERLAQVVDRQVPPQN